MVNNPGATLGQFVGLPGSFPVRLNKATGITVTRGKVTKKDASTDPDSWVQASAAANQQGPFAIPVATVGTGKLRFSTRYNDVFYLMADADIEPGSPVQCATATSGDVITFADSSVAVTPTQTDVAAVQADRKRVIGICLGSADTWNTGAPVKATDGNLAAVFVPLQ
ncbi:MAG TPA: hypothetical protein VL854_09710 [Nitrososphaeraceae archaeon]|jgi:hypothetical protein|nr:hypothetical protein [Nitrososphaeraceae archaeon]